MCRSKAGGRTYRKLTAIVAVVVLCGSMLCGCGNQMKVDVTPQDADVKISFSWWGNDVRHSYTMDGVDQFQEKNQNIDVEYRYGEWNGYESRMRVWMKSHTETDVMQINYAWLNTYSPDGSGYYDLYQLSDVIDLDNFSKENLLYGEKNGKLNAIPIAFNTSTVYYNKDIYDAYGLEIPSTWEDLFEAAKVMRKDGIYPLGMAKKHLYLLLISYFEQKNGQRAFDKEGKLLLQEEDIKSILEFCNELITEQVIPGANQFKNTMFAAGKVAGCVCWVSDAGNYCNGLKEAGGTPVIGAYPHYADQKLSGRYIKPATMYAISALTEHPKEAGILLNYLLNDPDMVRYQATEKGVPISKAALDLLQSEHLMDSYETEAYGKMMAEKNAMSVMLPVMENDTLINIFKQSADEYIYAGRDVGEVAAEIYQGLCDAMSEAK